MGAILWAGIDRVVYGATIEHAARHCNQIYISASDFAGKSNEYSPEDITEARVADNFHLLQACDNLSLLTCVDYQSPANLLHALPMKNGGRQSINVEHLGKRHFQLSPYPFAKSPLTIHFPARFVQSSHFTSNEELRVEFNDAAIEQLSVTVEE